MTEITQLEELVVNAVADDYENFDQITIDVTRWASEEGVESDSALILSALKHLVVLGLVDAHELSATEGPTIVRNIDWKLPIELYFYRSPLLSGSDSEGRG